MSFKPLAAAVVMAALAYPIMPAHAVEVSQQTTDFVQNASIGNMFEIESSRLALKQTSARDVKDFAQQMVVDHTQIGDQMKKALGASGTGLSPATTLDSEHQQTLDSLKAASAANFDNLFVQAQVKAHDDTVNLFSDYAQKGDDDSLKKFASDTLPTLKKHQQMANDLSRTYVSAHK